jgi:hypothetical protein
MRRLDSDQKAVYWIPPRKSGRIRRIEADAPSMLRMTSQWAHNRSRRAEPSNAGPHISSLGNPTLYTAVRDPYMFEKLILASEHQK